MAQRIKVSAQDHERITAAIRAAESKTSGEIFAAVAYQSDDYFFVSSFMAALWALLLGAFLAIMFTWGAPMEWFAGQASGWDNVETDSAVLTPLTLALAQIFSFLAFIILFRIFPVLGFWFVPRSIANRRASSNAVRQFLAHGTHTTQNRSGILLFMSLAERYAEVVADSGISEKVSQDQWDDMVRTLTEHAAKGDVAGGFIDAVEQAGTLLAQHFPPIEGDKNELDDRLVEL